MIQSTHSSGTEEPNQGNGQGLLKQLQHRLRTLLRGKTQTLKESLEEALEEHDAAGGYIDPEEKEMLRNVLEFSELTVEDVMVPRSDIIAIPEDIAFDALKLLLLDQEYPHTRLPVYHGSLDDVVGFLHMKDVVKVLCGAEIFNVEKLVREILFVPPSMEVRNLLVTMRVSRVHMAVVVDEFGGTTGLVTLEDLMEEIVGDIEDEHDTVDDITFTELGQDIIRASARMDIEELEKRLGIQLRKADQEDYDTLGGLIYSLTGRIPITGEIISHPAGYEFEITEADPRSVKTVLIRRKEAETSSEEKAPARKAQNG
ncbi:MAG: HlyC/CorC family transporter [Rickettsiales bacterium]|nr:HlyC/CorC family transporter [Rickettsiales bacterium]